MRQQDSAPEQRRAHGPAPAWAAVMPVFNESADLEGSLRALRGQFIAADLPDAPIVVVDDGSTDGTGQLADVLADELGLNVVHQANAGRFAARHAGLAATQAEMVLLIDCGLQLADGAVDFLVAARAADPDRAVWNGDVTVEAGDRHAAFWSVLTTVGWRRYFADRRLTSFTAAEFDAYPKGTTMFAAPREWLLEACAAFRPKVGEQRLASDDTALIRAVLDRAGRIWLAPPFGCTYTARTGARAFARQGLFRGTTFVDGYLRAAGQVGRALRAGLVAAPVAAVALAVGCWLAPLPTLGTAAALLVLGTAAVSGLALRCGCAPRDVAGFVAAAPLFVVSFGGGLVRGLVLAASAGRHR